MNLVVLQIGAKVEILKDLMETVWTKMGELESALKKVRAYNIPILIEYVRKDSKTETANAVHNLLSNKTRSKIQAAQSASALLCFFKVYMENVSFSIISFQIEKLQLNKHFLGCISLK